LAQDYVNQTAWRLVREIPDLESLRVLELGCGDGLFLQRLMAEASCKDVRGTTFRSFDEDYIREREFPAEIASRVDAGVDLNQALPYPDASFDVVVSIEVIEHVEGHRSLCVEAARVLKPGGFLVLTTPNVHRLASRLRFLLSGVHQVKRDLPPGNLPVERLEEYHQRCVDFPLLHWLLWRGGLRIETMEVSKAKPLSVVALALLPAIWPAARSAALRKAKPGEDAACRRDLLRWLMSQGLLVSEQLCVRARKLSGE